MGMGATRCEISGANAIKENNFRPREKWRVEIGRAERTQKNPLRAGRRAGQAPGWSFGFFKTGWFRFQPFFHSRQFFGYFLSAQKVVPLSANQLLLRTGIKRHSPFCSTNLDSRRDCNKRRKQTHRGGIVPRKLSGPRILLSTSLTRMLRCLIQGGKHRARNVPIPLNKEPVPNPFGRV